MLHGPRVLSKRSSAYGNMSGSTSPLLGAPHGWHLPLFARAPPPRLESWSNTGLDRGLPKDVPLLQGRIKDLLKGDLNLVKVTQVMLIRRTLPGQRRPLRLWEFNPEGPRVLQNLLGMTPMEMYRLFFGPQGVSPDLTEDAGLSRN